jgi:hypothetical protein
LSFLRVPDFAPPGLKAPECGHGPSLSLPAPTPLARRALRGFEATPAQPLPAPGHRLISRAVREGPLVAPKPPRKDSCLGILSALLTPFRHSLPVRAEGKACDHAPTATPFRKKSSAQAGGGIESPPSREAGRRHRIERQGRRHSESEIVDRRFAGKALKTFVPEDLQLKGKSMGRERGRLRSARSDCPWKAPLEGHRPREP